jgi:hypothetical protein
MLQAAAAAGGAGGAAAAAGGVSVSGGDAAELLDRLDCGVKILSGGFSVGGRWGGLAVVVLGCDEGFS